eukprot:TRINITY_DN48180_c0_g1_i1.p1 TRINITY_DN48180_c0_g1~~TRINITY_DN48180_c0_g1_i1.p1  ORF type:complete len:485 (-),score=60.47 TRINITY_DN48180_c0_g1_i1:109-1563(-)
MSFPTMLHGGFPMASCPSSSRGALAEGDGVGARTDVQLLLASFERLSASLEASLRESATPRRTEEQTLDGETKEEKTASESAVVWTKEHTEFDAQLQFVADKVKLGQRRHAASTVQFHQALFSHKDQLAAISNPADHTLKPNVPSGPDTCASYPAVPNISSHTAASLPLLGQHVGSGIVTQTSSQQAFVKSSSGSHEVPRLIANHFATASSPLSHARVDGSLIGGSPAPIIPTTPIPAVVQQHPHNTYVLGPSANSTSALGSTTSAPTDGITSFAWHLYGKAPCVTSSDGPMGGTDSGYVATEVASSGTTASMRGGSTSPLPARLVTKASSASALGGLLGQPAVPTGSPWRGGAGGPAVTTARSPATPSLSRLQTTTVTRWSTPLVPTGFAPVSRCVGSATSPSPAIDWQRSGAPAPAADWRFISPAHLQMSGGVAMVPPSVSPTVSSRSVSPIPRADGLPPARACTVFSAQQSPSLPVQKMSQ